MFQIKVVGKIETNSMFNKFFLKVFEITSKNTVQPDETQVTVYYSAHTLHTGYLRLQTHSKYTILHCSCKCCKHQWNWGFQITCCMVTSGFWISDRHNLKLQIYNKTSKKNKIRWKSKGRKKKKKPCPQETR